MPLPWAAALHRLWRGVSALNDRDDLAEFVLPPLLELPGVRAVWGLRHTADNRMLAYRWAGPPVTEADRPAAAAAAFGPQSVVPAFGTLVAHGAARVVRARFDLPEDVSGSILVAVDDTADLSVISVCLGQVVEVTSEAVRRIALHRVEQRQQIQDALLAEASLQMDAVLDTAQTMQRVARMTVPAIAEGCLVYEYDAGKLILRSAVHVDMRRLNAALADPAEAARFVEFASGVVLGGGPSRQCDKADVQVMRARDRILGVLLFLFDRDADRVPPAEFLHDVASRAAIAVDNSTLYEQRRREVAAMQQHLLPSRLPEVDGLVVAASYTVGDQVLEVGGDFYDVVLREDGTMAALIGDVCGRGVDAAALTGMARHTLAALLQDGASPVRAMSRLNTRLRLNGSWRFVTAGVATVRPDGDGFVVGWTSAGHPAPVVLRRDGPAEPGQGGGSPLGILTEPRLGRSELRLAAGDTLVIFTDGLTESRKPGGRMFEERAFGETLARLRGSAADAVVKELSLAAASYGGVRADDIAVVAIQVRETAS
ncbi:hypothetical protein GCM10010172_73620 [Paractinoplanes ferrugineus]|uniref:PPM-type phosphatase domain-containing protein n=1 Tax=Paractinoplanes ferrugineus TaxID=113564 RepID=A0A919J078_9ACTN|nr:PP2C family protein-serine/threonine phosphatase [Actinoplanes ferrugineus]GIE11483.1 hypothetical protein Afe05nite_33230 [Actinoplanes ferrugineus]